MSQGMTVAALVRMAGGFKRSAYRDEPTFPAMWCRMARR
jgi:hypothetical protein